VIASHIGTNPETQRLMLTGQLAVELVPQGTLAERIRAGGAGLGGVLTATGIGTLAAEGRQVLRVDGREFRVEPALKADVALVAARSADYAGNLVYSLTARNFNPADTLKHEMAWRFAATCGWPKHRWDSYCCADRLNAF
jgi:acetate CoA/acetoacetate CoA-transferase alpha subunit